MFMYILSCFVKNNSSENRFIQNVFPIIIKNKISFKMFFFNSSVRMVCLRTKGGCFLFVEYNFSESFTFRTRALL